MIDFPKMLTIGHSCSFQVAWSKTSSVFDNLSDFTRMFHKHLPLSHTVSMYYDFYHSLLLSVTLFCLLIITLFSFSFISCFLAFVGMNNYIFITHFPLYWFESFAFQFYPLSGYISIMCELCKRGRIYHFQNPRSTLPFQQHFSSILFWNSYIKLKSKENNQQGENAT